MINKSNEIWKLKIKRFFPISIGIFFTISTIFFVTGTFNIGFDFMRSHTGQMRYLAYFGLIFIAVNFRKTIIFPYLLIVFGWSMEVTNGVVTIVSPVKKTIIKFPSTSISNVRFLENSEINAWDWPANKPSILRIYLNNGTHHDVFANDTIDNPGDIVDFLNGINKNDRDAL